jgi:hypothetical protein
MGIQGWDKNKTPNICLVYFLPVYSDIGKYVYNDKLR